MQRRDAVGEYRAFLAKASENSSQMEAPTTSAQLYCLCRSFDRSQFMIACHHCGVQYHGRCVGVAEQAATFILQYACPPCRDKDATLNVIYKVPDTDQCPQPGDDEETVEMQESTDGEDNCSLMDPFSVGWFHNYAKADKRDIAEDAENVNVKDQPRRDRQDSVVEVVSGNEAEEKLTSNDTVKKLSSQPKKKKRRRGCKKCSACAITEDCGVCMLCRDKPKFGGAGILKQKCVKRRCLRLPPIHRMPYTSATKRVQQVSKKKKKKYLKDKHREDRQDSVVEVISGNKSEEKQTSKHVVKKFSSKHKGRKKRNNCKECSACAITEDCGVCWYCRDKPKFGGGGILKQKCVKRRCLRLTPIHRMPYTSAIKRVQQVSKKKKKKKYLKDKYTKDRRDSVVVVISDDESEEKQTSKDMDKKLPSKPKEKKKKQGCKKCFACTITEDCGVCMLCRDMPKFGGSGHLKQKCVKRRCLRLSPNSYTHLRFQCDSVVDPLTKQVGGKTKQGPCQQCAPSQRPDCRKCKYCLDMVKYGGEGRLRTKCKFRRCDVTCAILDLQKQNKHTKDRKGSKDMDKKLPSTPKKRKRNRGCKKCSACAITEDCGVCLLCRDMPKFGGSGHLKQKCVKRRCLRLSPTTYTRLHFQNGSVVNPFTKIACRQCAHSQRPDCRKCKYCLDMKKYGGKGRLRSKCVLRRCDVTCATLRLRKQEEMMKAKCQRDRCKNFSTRWSNYCSDLCEIRATTRSALSWMTRKISSLRESCEDKQILSELELLQLEVTAVKCRMVEMSRHIRELRYIVGRARRANAEARGRQGGDQENLMDCPEGITVVRESKLACFMNKRCKNPASINVVGQTWGAENITTKADTACCCPLVPHLFDRTSNYCRVPQCECREHQGWEILLKTEVELERVREWLWLIVLMEKLQDLEMMTR